MKDMLHVGIIAINLVVDLKHAIVNSKANYDFTLVGTPELFSTEVYKLAEEILPFVRKPLERLGNKMWVWDDEEEKWGTICTPVRMLAPDGKLRMTQSSTIEGIFRIIQSIPSPKAEQFNQVDGGEVTYNQWVKCI